MVKVLQRWPFNYSMFLIVLIGITTFVGMLMLDQEATASASQQATMVSFALPDEAYAGELIPVTLVVDNAQNLGGFQSKVVFDVKLRLADSAVEVDLERGGRDILQLGPVSQDGSVVIGAVTCPTSTCQDSYGKRGQPLKGADGHVALATIQLYTDIPGAYELKLENVKLVDPQGNFLAAGSVNRVLQVRAR